MRLIIQCVLLLLCLTVYVTQAANPHNADIEDNDFAEFEDFDDDDKKAAPSPSKAGTPPPSGQPKVVMAPEADIDPDMDDDDAMVEIEDEEADHFDDDEEFVGFDPDKSMKGKGPERPPDLKITPVPAYLQNNWDSFYMEMLMLAGLGVYLINFLAGKAKNSKLSTSWFQAHRALLEEHFAIVGDDGTSKEVQSGVLMKESENIYSLWCSGRVCCEGMLVTLKLLKRQDLVSTISNMFRPASDQIIVKLTLDPSEMDTFVMCLAQKKVINKMQKDMVDLAYFCPEKRKLDDRFPPSYQLLSEIPEASNAVIDGRVIAALNMYENVVESIHISDQFCGPRPQDDTQPSKMPETSKVLIFTFNVPGKGKCSPTDMQAMEPLMKMVFHCLEKVRRIRLTKEGKQKAEKNRQRLTETYLKASHTQRSEAAQERREKKRRADKERMMAEEDPDRQRKLEEKTLKKDQKKKQPKVKMMKIKAM